MSNSIMVITCMKKKAKIKSIQNVTMITFKEERVKIKSNSPQKSMWITCTQNKMNSKSNSIQNIMRVTCMQKKVKMESNSPQNIQKKLDTKSNSSQMCPQVTFSVWISELIFSRAK